MDTTLFPYAKGSSGRYIMVDANGYLVATAPCSGFLYGCSSDTGRPLMVDGYGRLIISPLSSGLLFASSLVAGNNISITPSGTSLIISAP